MIRSDNTINPVFAAALNADTYSRFMADRLAESDVDIVIGRVPTEGGDASAIVPADGGRFHVEARSPGRPGLTQESLVADPGLFAGTSSPYPYAIGSSSRTRTRSARPRSRTWRRSAQRWAHSPWGSR